MYVTSALSCMCMLCIFCPGGVCGKTILHCLIQCLINWCNYSGGKLPRLGVGLNVLVDLETSVLWTVP